jgi:hypothetical protein
MTARRDAGESGDNFLKGKGLPLPRPGQGNYDVLIVLTNGYGPDPVGAASATGKNGTEYEQGQQKMDSSQTQLGHDTGKL